MELLGLRDITKYFPETGTLANDGISLSLRAGEIRAVVGENGAGKSTLARIAAGLARPDSGRVLVRGTERRFHGARDAERAGIGLVPQGSFLAPELSVAENLALGREPLRAGFLLDRRRALLEAAEIASEFGFRIDPAAAVVALSPAERRQADIMRALVRGGDILILDEPTTLLTESETAALFALLRRLAAAGKAVLYISHRADEVRSLAGSLSVLRGGRLVAELEGEELQGCELGELMANRAAAPPSACDPPDPAPRSAGPRSHGPGPRPGGPPALELRGLVLDPARGSPPISLSLGAGEVLGLAALAGNGLDRLEALVAGLERPARGEVLVAGRPLGAIPRRELRRRLLSYVPADRDRLGLVPEARISDNLLALEVAPQPRLGPRAAAARATRAAALAAGLGPAGDSARRAASLSGGNRQRLLLSRELDPRRLLALLAEPAQGLDLAGQESVRARILELARGGAAVLVLSSNLDELLAVADRIGILYRGGLVHLGPNSGAGERSLLTSRLTGGEAA